MRLLIVNTLPRENPAVLAAVQELSEAVSDCRVIHACEMDLRPCVGCNACWLKTPGVCAIRDGCEEILKACLAYDATVFLAGTALHFVDHRIKNVIDRFLPLVTMYTYFSDGQCRHVPRYEKRFHFGLLYAGMAEQAYLNEWLGRMALNFGGSSLGALPITQAKEVLPCT